MIKLLKTDEQYTDLLAVSAKHISVGNISYFFDFNEDFPIIPSMPEITENQLAELEYIEQDGKLLVQWNVKNKSEEQIKAEFNQLAESKEQIIEVSEIKELLKDIVEAKPEAEQINFTSIFPEYRVGKTYVINEQFRYNKQLYKVIQAHTSQADWRPDVLPALYKKVGEPDDIQDFKQPTGAHDAYQKGDKVRFEGSTYESLIDANVYSPTAYPQGWKKL